MYNATCRVELDAAHRLWKYDGACANIHGHRYVVEVTVEGNRLDELGMLLDFGKLKKAVLSWVNLVDHKLILNVADPLGKSAPIGQKGDSIRFMNGNPTAENMAAELFRFVSMSAVITMETDVRVVNVRLYETPDCWCDYAEPEEREEMFE